jgi:hypothetical protein
MESSAKNPKQIMFPEKYQVCDIYSFGIIMQEIICTGAPYCMTGLNDSGLNFNNIF